MCADRAAFPCAATQSPVNGGQGGNCNIDAEDTPTWNAAANKPSGVGAAERERLEPARRFIEQHFMEHPPLVTIARSVHLSRFHFHRRFTSCFGETPKSMLARLQVEQAKRLLLAGQSSGEVSRACGFMQHSHFSVRFKRLVGYTPMRWLAEERRRERIAD
jgi:AraC-like DNA-binding protein